MTEDRLYSLIEEPELEDPVLVLAMEGWIDAGDGAEIAMDHLMSVTEPELLATFDTDALLDYRSRRPTMHLVEGHVRDLAWPTIELHVAMDGAGRDLLLLRGAEPDHLWNAFADQVVLLAQRFNTSLVVGLGAYPAPLPHTRISRLSATATRPELADRRGWVRGTLDVPAGIQAAIESRAASAGIPALGVWAQVPHYAAAMPYEPASLRLLQGLAEVSGTEVDLTRLVVAAEATQKRLTELVENSAEHAELVRQLEAHVDATAEDEDVELPSGDELAAEFQRFLRQQGPGEGPGGLGPLG